ncbi:MAG: S26 family signal peptidase [Thermodesulfobacteriota bacterium]
MNKRNQFWLLFAAKGLLVVTLIIAAEMWIASRYHIGLVANIPCLPARMYLYRFTSSEQFGRGDQMVFKTDSRHFPRFQVGTRFLKTVQCLPGEEVDIDSACHVRCTGPDGPVYDSKLEDGVLQILGRSCTELASRYRIPPDNYFVVGTFPHSYDSRYWGLVKPEQVVGKVVWVLWGYDSKDREKDLAMLKAAGKGSYDRAQEPEPY